MKRLTLEYSYPYREGKRVHASFSWPLHSKAAKRTAFLEAFGHLAATADIDGVSVEYGIKY